MKVLLTPVVPLCNITHHAYIRARQRFSLKPEALERVAGRALQEGLCRSQVTGRLARYFDKLWLQERKARNIRLYGEFLFLFHQDTLITLWQLPNGLRKLAAVIRKKQVHPACK